MSKQVSQNKQSLPHHGRKGNSVRNKIGTGIGIAGLVCIVWGALSLVGMRRTVLAFWDRYEQLRPGMTRTEVEQLFERPPDYVCRFRDATLIYYRRGMFTDAKAGNKPLPRTISHRENIPILYGNAQLLFNRRGNLVAYTLNGETDKIVTKSEKYPGSVLQTLDDETLDRLLVP
jgi:hypothetical protein